MVPYRALERHDDAPGEFFYAPETTAVFGPGMRLFGSFAVVGAIGGVVAGYGAFGTTVGVVLGLVFGTVRRATSDAAGILLRVRNGTLTIGRGKRGRVPLAEAPINSILDVRIETETLYDIRTIRLGPDFGTNPTGKIPQIGIDEARIAIVLRDRPKPVYLTSARVANLDAEESADEIRDFLRLHGWRPKEEHSSDVEDASAGAVEGNVLLSERRNGKHYVVAATMKASEFVLRARRVDEHDGSIVASEYVIEAEHVPALTERLLELSDDPDRYAKDDGGCLLVELVRDVFVNPHGVEAVAKLTEWLENMGIPYVVS